ncbi:MAG TPA: sulfotransferase, partial [Jatrophihabitantaceae bacterium]
RRNLQLIGLNEPDKRWVLKNPSHLFAVDALLEVYPDALVVQCHRDPRTIVASSSSLSAHATRDQSEVFLGPVIGRDQLDLWARGARLCTEARERHDAAHFLDVRYEDFVADPIGVVQRVYDRLEVPFADEARAAMTSVHEQTRASGARPSHTYSLADFGLTEADVDAAFDGYRERYLA